MAATWRLGMPAALMVAFALVGLATSGRDEDTARPVASTAPPLVAVGAHASPAAPPPAGRVVERTDEARPEVGSGLPAVPEGGTAPAVRLPEELGPAAPDVIVALEPAAVDGEQPAAAVHTHLPESLYDGARAPATSSVTPAQASDDFQGPEPGALYWFGPRGLERIKILGEARR
jgi:hypothetical protein